MTVTIVDYGAGNLRSVVNTLSELGSDYEVVRRPADVLAASKLILPGVGHIGQMMRALDELKLREALTAKARSGIPFLGICLGLQAMFESSAEDEAVTGLGLFPGRVERFPSHLRCPHMGWNSLTPLRGSRLLKDLAPVPYVYFAHSYYCPVVSDTAAICTYELPYTAVLEQGPLSGVQFHPEKSGPVGLKIVKNFLEL